MAGKVSFKTAIISFFSCGIVIILSACIVPIDIDVFMSDKEVQKLIDTTKVPPPSVKIDPGSDSGLKAGNGRISGLVTGKYYKVEVIENNVVSEEPCFVTASGTLSQKLKDIKKATGGVITGLTNDVTYRVKSAKPYTNSAGITHFKLDGSAQRTTPAVTGGTVTIPNGSPPPCYFTVSSTIDENKFYDVMNVGKWGDARTSAKKITGGSVGSSLSNTDNTNYEFHNPDLPFIGIFQYRSGVTVTPSFLNSKSVMELPAVDTVNDYVFVEYTSNGSTNDFYYLTVTVKYPTGNGNVTITEPNTTDNAPTLTYNSNPINEGTMITIPINAPSKTITANNTCKWFHDNVDTPFITGNSITIGTAPLNAVGTYTIMVEVTIGSVDYSTWFILKITN